MRCAINRRKRGRVPSQIPGDGNVSGPSPRPRVLSETRVPAALPPTPAPDPVRISSLRLPGLRAINLPAPASAPRSGTCPSVPAWDAGCRRAWPVPHPHALPRDRGALCPDWPGDRLCSDNPRARWSHAWAQGPARVCSALEPASAAGTARPGGGRASRGRRRGTGRGRGCGVARPQCQEGPG